MFNCEIKFEISFRVHACTTSTATPLPTGIRDVNTNTDTTSEPRGPYTFLTRQPQPLCCRASRGRENRDGGPVKNTDKRQHVPRNNTAPE